MVLLGGWKTVLLPLVIVVACGKFLFGCFALLFKKWFSIDLIDRWSIKGTRCSLQGLFKTNSTQGELTRENLQFFSKVVLDFYHKQSKKNPTSDDVASLSGVNSEKSIVKSFQLDKSAINYLADINFFVEIEYDLDHPWVKQVNPRNLPQSVFIKSLPRRVSGRIGQVLLGIHECEGIHFAEVFSTQEWFPTDIMPPVLYANYNYITTDYLLITEDLRGKYYFRGYSPKTITREERLKALETIAKLHASGMAYLRSLSEKERESKISEMEKRTPFLDVNAQTSPDLIMLLIHRYAAKKMSQNGIDSDIVDYSKQFFQSSRINAKLRLCEGSEEMLSFVHRDLHFNNIGIAHEMVNGIDTVSIKLIDWQCCGLGNPLFDLFYMLCFTSDLETVESIEKEYLENYYSYICKELEQKGLSKPKQLQTYENYLEFYKYAMCSFLTWGLGIQLVQLQTKDTTSEIYIAAKNHLLVGSYLLKKYDFKSRVNKILN